MFTCVALGKFDGVHLGHKKIIDKTIEISKSENLIPVAYVIDISHILTSNAEKEEIFKSFGVEKVVFEKFDDNFKNLSPKEFFDKIIIKKLNAKHIVVGTDYRFGKNREGNIDILEFLCRENKIKITVVDKLTIDGIEVSSTKIKEFIQYGNIKDANKFLGRNYSVEGFVAEGKKLGRKMGFPTVNLTTEKSVIFKSGVYITKTHFNNEEYKSITNIGINPTVDSDEKTKIETYIFDFSKEIYGKNIKIEFLHHLRDEKKFQNLDALISQIAQDKEKCKKYFEKMSKKYLQMEKTVL